MRTQTVIGGVARGDKFFERPYEVDKIWRFIENGNHLLIAAPRRVGKTSLMRYVQDNSKDDYKIIYLDTESVNKENEFFRKLLHELTKEFNSKEKYKVLLKGFMSKIDKVETSGFELGENKINYFDEVVEFLDKLNLEGIKLVLMIDEFAQTVQNIINDEGKDSAIHFLEVNRELRQKEFDKMIQYVYAGSIGLENVVSRIGRTSDINDLASMKLSPLTTEDTEKLVAKITKDSGLIFENDVITHMIEKIEWLIPYYIQILVDTVDELEMRRESEIKVTKELIDKAFNQMLENRTYFSHWHDRLKTAYKSTAEYNFAKDILNHASEHEKITRAEIFDYSQKYSSDNLEYKEILNELKYDGYLNNDGDKKIYRFNSPILRIWWDENVAN